MDGVEGVADNARDGRSRALCGEGQRLTESSAALMRSEANGVERVVYEV